MRASPDLWETGRRKVPVYPAPLGVSKRICKRYLRTGRRRHAQTS